MDERRDYRLITSLHNPTIRFVRHLQERRFRYRERAVMVEGIRSIRTALANGANIRAILFDERRRAELQVDLSHLGLDPAYEVTLVAGNVFAEIVGTEQPQSVVAICDMPELTLPADATLVLALDGIRDPGNLGTLLRTATAAGVDAVVLLPGCVDPFGPKVVRASTGYAFALPIRQFPDVARAAELLFADQPAIVAAEAGGASSWDAVNWVRPTLLVLGGETSGIGETTRTYANELVSIPMPSEVESLNVAAAGAVLLFECVRQRRETFSNSLRTYAGDF